MKLVDVRKKLYLIFYSYPDCCAGLQNKGSPGSTAPRKFKLKHGSARKL